MAILADLLTSEHGQQAEINRSPFLGREKLIESLEIGVKEQHSLTFLIWGV
ncbi:hypothetical protein K4A83_13875 [Spirulina subsalsa FACHB-351]|uniref:Uncharacterized protein n=1 Tax=Spirulina subsalsa FACHB-351 TaxID=234711 RepID=A0ABT3L7C9_9CYAN|nr:hypothetical protein [Spirulina subsalsa]MCW6037352.1 hypothetical protein [Spirulina subsalsa FACHB-351]